MMEENIRGTSQIVLTHEYMTQYKCFVLTNHFNTTEKKRKEKCLLPHYLSTFKT